MKEIFDTCKLEEVDIASDIVTIRPFQNTMIRIESSSNNESTEPYFKLFLGENIYYPYDNNLKMCRISMMSPKYIIGIGSDLNLTEDQIKLLIDLFKEKNEYDSSKTNWEYLIYCYKSNMHNQSGYMDIPEDLPIPNYLKLNIANEVLHNLV